ncbi:hypothetical protein O6H91_08G078700 [Diphasiastrum complanatum]|uniref:Uncharacterized protein n=1 Tax=Diphasiastrum complanatum TaxID=34168 RepID=A0ACC2CZ66_DIPCM|nr:hypothetical protein O6H91_08G078700 [Diphasiastrum complanatum]
MAALKYISRSATAAFAPTSQYLAAATQFGAIDLTFSSSACLEILKLDFASSDLELEVVGSFPTSERFNRLSWGRTNIGSGFPYGVIAGGLVDGIIYLWNPAKLISGDATEPDNDALLAQLQKHTGAVRGLEFNDIAPNLLASGAEDGELCIWDLSDPHTPSHFPSLKGSGSGANMEISYLSWNRKVQHILASTSYGGTSVVWDLKRQKPVISFTDPATRRRCSSLQWNPEVATQLIVSSDDDRSPSLQVWDLRNSVSPVKELVGHTKGVLAMAWCPSDSSLLLTCAKDNRTLCWDTVSGEILCELPSSSNWNFDVQWSPRTPGVLSTSSFDGKIGIYNIEACSRVLPSDCDFGGAIVDTTTSVVMKAPKWLKRPVGASFGFGGKLVTFGPKKLTPGLSSATSSEVRIHSLLTEEGLVQRSTEFEAAIMDAEKPTLRDYCEQKSSMTSSKDEKEIWSFLKVMFEDDARRKLLSHLDFAVQVSENGGVVESGDQIKDKGEELGGKDISNAASTNANITEATSEDLNLNGVTPDLDEETEKAIQRALVVGDFKVAVEHCLSANRMADALILAYVGGTSLWERTQNEYMQRNRRPYLKVVSAVVNNDLKRLISSRPLTDWKETLALLCTYAQSEDWTLLSDALAARLDSAGETHAATLCYICAGNIDRAVEIWSRNLNIVIDGTSFVDELQDLMEKAVVLGLATGQKRFSASLARFVGSYAELLASQGLLTTAMDYISLVPPEDLPHSLAILQDRINKSVQVTEGKVESQNLFETSGPEPVISPVVSDQPNYSTAHPQSSQQYHQEVYQQGGGVSYGNTFQPQYVPQQLAPQPVPSYRVPEASYNPTASQYYYPPTVPQPQPQPIMSPYPPRVSGFIPSTPPPIPNVDQYQQPSAAPLYQQGVSPSPGVRPYPPAAAPVAAVPTAPPRQPTNVPSMMLPAPAIQPTVPAPRSFNPVNTPMPQPPQVHQGTNAIRSPSIQPLSALLSSNTVVASPPSPAPQAPPPTVHNVDTSNVGAELKPAVAALTKLFNETSEALGGSKANPAKRREIEDNSRKLGTLFVKLNSADLSANATSKLIQLCQALDAGDYATAFQIQVGLTTSDWDECSYWLAALKRMIKTRQVSR